MTTPLSRRSLVANLALAAPLAATAAACHPIPTRGLRFAEPEEGGADPELLALGREFDRLHAAWLSTVPACDAAEVAIEVHVRARREAEPDYDGISVAQGALVEERAAQRQEEEAFGALAPLSEAIIAASATTPAGLAVKARALIVAMWDRGTYAQDVARAVDEDWDKRHARALIDACLTLVGVDQLGRPIGEGVA